MRSKGNGEESNECLDEEPVFEDPFEEEKEIKDKGGDALDEMTKANAQGFQGPPNDSSFGDQNVEDNFHEAIRKATAVRVDKLQSMMRSKYDMYQVLHVIRKLKFLSIISITL